MKKTLAFILAALMGVSLVACGGGEGEKENTKAPENNAEEQKQEAPAEKTFDELKAEFSAKTAEDLIKESFADRKNPTAAEFAKLYANYAFVDFDDKYEHVDNAVEEAVKLLRDEGAKVTSATAPEVIKALLASEYSGARAFAYREQATNNISKDAEIYGILKEKALTETEPAVVYSVLRGLPQSFGDDAEFIAYLLPNAENADANVRRAVAIAYSRCEFTDKAPAVEAIVKLMGDSESAVQDNALRYAGCVGDDGVIDAYKAVLSDASQKKLHGNALTGLVELWYGYPTHKRTSEAAYRATIDYLKTETTDPDIPAWNGITAFKMKGSQSAFDAWKAQATYFDEKEVVAVMQALVGDAEASKLVKQSAIDMISVWGTLEDLQATKAIVEALPAEDKNRESLISKCDTAISKK